MQTLVEGCPLHCILCSHNGFSPAKASFVCSTPVHRHIRLTPTHRATSNKLATKTRNLDDLRQNLSQTFSSEENSNSLQPSHYQISVTPEQGVQLIKCRDGVWTLYWLNELCRKPLCKKNVDKLADPICPRMKQRVQLRELNVVKEKVAVRIHQQQGPIADAGARDSDVPWHEKKLRD